MRVVAAQFVRAIPAVVSQITKLCAIHAMAVSALELRVRIAGLDTRRAQRHVVLVRPVATIVHPVTDLIPDNMISVVD